MGLRLHQNVLEISVRSTEMDVNGHVNNAKFLEYLEWGRENWYESQGLDYQTLKKAGIVTVVVHVSADYKREAIQNDKLSIHSWLHRVGNTSFTMKQNIWNQRQETVLSAEFVIVTVHPDTRLPVRVPELLRQLIAPPMIED
jgi:thioesterase III